MYQDGEDRGAAFEERIRSTDYPAGVDAWSSAEDGVSARIGWLRRNHASTVGKASELSKRLRAVEKSAKQADQRVQSLEKRLKALEKRTSQGLYRRVRRAAGRVLRKLGLRR